MGEVARVVLALEAPEVTEEVLHFLDRSGKARVVGTAADDRQLSEAIRQLEPDVVVAEPLLAHGGVDGAALLALSSRESVAALRGAVKAGARSPAERRSWRSIPRGEGPGARSWRPTSRRRSPRRARTAS